MQVSTTAIAPKIELHLGDPSMTLLHRAGLVGLYMSLKSLEDQSERPAGLRWELLSRSVRLYWDCTDMEALDWLLRQSFQIDKKTGLIALSGLVPDSMDLPTQVTVHQGIRGTFLQHPSTYKAIGIQSQSFQIEDDGPEIVVKYQALASYAHQGFAKDLCDARGHLLSEPISVAGWLNPGAVVRHVAFSSQTGFEEAPQNAFVLLFALVACQYFVLRSTLRDKRAQYALVVPEVSDLDRYARRRLQLRGLGYKEFHASNLGDAGLKFLTHAKTIEMIRKSQAERCQVLTLGTVAWSSQQKSRTALHVVEATEKASEIYQLACRFFEARTITTKEGGFVVPSFAREIIAENLAASKPWYADFARYINNSELFKKITYERSDLNRMVQNAAWNDEVEKLFVTACHEALLMRGGKLKAEAAKRREKPNYDRLTEGMRTGILRCKNAETFREFITDFWSRAGSVPTLQKHWPGMIALINDERKWKTAKDLALLALASYKPPASQVQAETTETEEETEE